MANLWYVGVGLEIVSTMSGTIGKQLIRLSELRKRKNPSCARMAFCLGLVVNTVCGPLLDMAAYSFAAQSLIAPFGGLDVVWNAILAPWILQETLTRRRLIGCVLIVTGTALCGVFGNHADSDYTLEYIEETLLTVRVLVYGLVFFGWFLLNRLVLMRQPEGSAVRGISLGCTAGTIAGNMFCVKGAIELIEASIAEQKGEIWLHWLPYALLVGAAFFALTNVIYMTKGLVEYEALFMVTIYEGSMIVSGCVSGSVVLLDLRDLEHWRIGLYCVGVGTIILGMYVIFSQESKHKSSLIAGTASVKELPAPASPMQKLQARSLHASISPINSLDRFSGDSPRRYHTEPALSPRTNSPSPAARRLDLEIGSPGSSGIDDEVPAPRPRAQSAPPATGQLQTTLEEDGPQPDQVARKIFPVDDLLSPSRQISSL